MADGESDIPSLDMNVDLWSGQIERRAVGPYCRHSEKQKAKQRQTTAHVSIVRSPLCEATIQSHMPDPIGERPNRGVGGSVDPEVLKKQGINL